MFDVEMEIVHCKIRFYIRFYISYWMNHFNPLVLPPSQHVCCQSMTYNQTLPNVPNHY